MWLISGMHVCFIYHCPKVTVKATSLLNRNISISNFSKLLMVNAYIIYKSNMQVLTIVSVLYVRVVRR